MEAERSLRRIKTVIRICAVILPLLAGALFYLVFDPDTALSARFYQFFPYSVRFSFPAAWRSIPLFRFCRNYLCDFLWAFSLESSVLLLLGCSRRGLIRSAGISFLLSFLLEFLQREKLVSGTFDLADILAETVAILMAGLIQYYLGGKANEKMGSRDVSGDGADAVHSVCARKWIEKSIRK